MKTVVKDINSFYTAFTGEESKEIVINDNAMIPLPGTYQADHIVKVIYSF